MNEEEQLQEDIKKSELEQKTQDEIIAKNINPPEESELDKYAKHMISTYTKPAVAEAMVNKDKFTEIYGDRFLEENKGNKSKAKVALDRVYEEMSKGYQDQAAEEFEMQVLDQVSFLAHGVDNIEFIGEEYAPLMYIAPETISGRNKVLDTWTDPTRTVEQVSLLAKKIVDYKGDIIEYDVDAYDEVALNKDYANKDGKTIVAFTYLPYSEYQRSDNVAIKAVYEGELPDGEVVSRYDTSNSFLSSNGLDTSTWKVGVGSIFDFVVDTVDTAFAFGEYAALGMTAGLISKTEAYKDFKDLRTVLSTGMMSKSKADKDSLVTLNNAVNIGINVLGQLLTGKAIATGTAKVLGAGVKASKAIYDAQKGVQTARKAYTAARTLTARAAAFKDFKNLSTSFAKQYKNYNRSANIVKRVTLASMGAMQAKGTADEAQKLGFTPAETAVIYFASLGTMMIANNLSNLGFERLGVKTISPIMKEAVGDVMKGTTKVGGATGIMKVFNSTKKITDTFKDKVTTVMSKGHVGNVISEGIEEETEFIFDELVKHTATAYSNIRYDGAGPKFKTMMDEGYWKEAGIESLLNMGVGGIAGGVSGIAWNTNVKGIKEEELPQKGETAKVLKHLAYYSKRTEKGATEERQFRELIAKKVKQGKTGRTDISTKWDSKNKRYKRVNELTKEDIAQGHASQAEIQGKAVIAQFEYYQHIYENEEGTLADVIDRNPELSFVTNSNTMYEEVRSIMDEKASIYAKSSSSGDIDFDESLKALQKEKDKADKEAEKTGERDDSKYQDKVDKFSKATGLTTPDMERLVEIDTQLRNIGNGKAMEDSFIKYQLESPKYKGKISYEDMKSLIEADTKAQKEFDEDLKFSLKEQSKNDTIISKHISSDGKLSQGLVSMIAGNPEGILLSAENKTKLRDGVELLGVSLDKQKISVQNKLLADLTIHAEAALKEDPYSIVDKEEIIDGKVLLDKLITELTQAVPKGSDAVRDVFKNNTDIALITPSQTDADKTIYPITKVGYTIKKILDVANIGSPNGFSIMQYDSNKISTVIRSNIEQAASPMRLGDSFSGFMNMGFPKETDVDGLNKLFMDDNTDINDILDPTRNGDNALFGVTNKTELLSIINRSNTFESGQKRVDLMHGYKRTASGKIITNPENLPEQYQALIKDVENDEGEVTFFSDLDGAQNLNEQINTRLQEIEFMLEFLPTLAKLDLLNKTEFDNDNPNTTFLTTYIEKHIIPFEEYQKNPENVEAYLINAITQLTALRTNTEELIRLAEQSSEDLNKKYRVQAAETVKKDLDSIHAFLTSGDADGLRKDSKYEETLNDVIAKINGLDMDDSSDANLATLYSAVFYIKGKLNSLYATEGSTFLDDLKKTFVTYDSVKRARIKKMLIYALSPADKINSMLKNVLAKEYGIAASDENAMMDLTLPIAEQLTWIEEMVVSATNHDFLNTLKDINGFPDNYASGAFFNGRQGAGKTKVILKYAADLIQKLNIENAPAETPNKFRGSIFAANNDGQRDNMLISATDVVTNNIADIQTNGVRTQQDLYNLLVDTDMPIEKLVELFDDVSTIFYDEVTLIEFGESKEDIKISRETPKEAKVLNAILAQIDVINKTRKGAPLIMIGVGDRTQPGFVEGDKSPRDPEGVPDKDKGTTQQNVLGLSLYKAVYVSTEDLTANFRSKVPGMAKAIEDFQTDMNVNRKGTEFEYDDSDDSHLGVEVKRESFGDLANDKKLIDDLRAKLKANKNFKVAIVAGIDGADTDIVNKQVDGKKTKLVELMEEYAADEGRIKIYSYPEVQGFEADYVLMYVPEGFLISTQESLSATNKPSVDEILVFKARVQKLKVALGRARLYARVAFVDSFDEKIVKSVNKHIEIDTPKTNVAFKEVWNKTLSGSILLSSERVDEEVENLSNTTAKQTTSTTNAPKVTDDVENTSLILTPLVLNTKHIEAQRIENSTTDSLIVNQDGAKRELKEIVESIAKKYPTVDISDMSVNSLKKLEAAIQTVINSSGQEPDAETAAKEDLRLLKSSKDLVLGIVTEESKAIQEDLDSTYEEKEQEEKEQEELSGVSNNASRVANAAFMREEEVTNNKVVAYQDIQTEKEISNPNLVKQTRALQLFGNEALGLVEADTALKEALKYDKGEAVFDTKNFKYYIVTSRGNGKDSTKTPYENHVLVGETKTGKRFIIAQFPRTDDFAKDGDMHTLLKSRLSRLKIAMQKEINDDPTVYFYEYQPKDKRKKTFKTYYIESTIANVNNVVLGTTVGNLVTSDLYTFNTIKEKHLLSNIEDLVEGKAYKTVNKDTTHTSRLRNYSDGWTEEAFDGDRLFDHATVPFVPFDSPPSKDKKTKAKIFRKIQGSKDHYTTIKTSKGYIPFRYIKDQNTWIPVIGVDEDGNIFSSEELLEEGGVHFDKELFIISDLLAGLDPEKHSKDLRSEIKTKNIRVDINPNLGITLESAGLIIQDTEGSKHKKFLEAFKDRYEMFLGNKKLPLHEAKEIWAQTGTVPYTSKPYVLLEGVHAGKAVIFYTFDEGQNLETYSTDEIISLYTNMIKHKNAYESNFTENRLGIGMMLLDPKGYTFSEIIENLSSAKLSTLTAADINKAVISGESGRILIKLFASIQKQLDVGKTVSPNIVEQLAGDNAFDADISSWIAEMEKNHSEEFKKLEAVFNVIFDAESLGKVEVTYAVDSMVSEVLHQAEMILGSNMTPIEITEQLDALFLEHAQVLGTVEITSANQLRAITISTDNDVGATGFLAINGKNKASLRKNPFTVISAIDTKWASEVYGDESIIPEPDFDMYNLIKVVHSVTKNTDLNIENVLPLLDSLLGNVGLTQGIFVSPVVERSSAPLAPIKTDIADVEKSYLTDVKRIKKPQIVFNTKELTRPGELTDSVQEVENTTKKEKEDTITKLNIRLSASDDSNKLRSLLDEVVDLEESKAITSKEAKILYNAISSKFNRLVPVSQDKDFYELDFSSYFLPIPGTLDFVNSFNTLRDLTINDEIKTLLWENLLTTPEAFTPSQRLKLNELLNVFNTTKALDSDKDLEVIFTTISKQYKSGALNSVPLRSMDKKLNAKMVGLAAQISSMEYHMNQDLDPTSRVLLFIGLNTNNNEETPEKLITASRKFDTTFSHNPVKAGNIRTLIRWTSKALDVSADFTSPSNEIVNDIIELEDVPSKNMLTIPNTRIAEIFKAIIENSDVETFKKFFKRLSKDIDNIYYNKDNKSHAKTLLVQLIDTMEARDITNDTELETMRNKLNINIIKTTDVDTHIKEGVNALMSTLTSTASVVELHKTNPEAGKLLDTFIKTLTTEQASDLERYINQDFTEQEIENGVARGIAQNTAKLITTINSDYEIASPVIDLIEDLSADEAFTCFV